MALNGIQLLLNYDIVPPADVKNILRVLIIQANSGRAESQLKLLQIILQLANFLSRDSASNQYMTESAICGFLTIAVQLCDIRNNVSVSSTAFATTRQIVTIVMNGVKTLYDSKKACAESSGESEHEALGVDFTSASITISAQMLIKDFSHFARGQPGEWIKGCYLALPLTLDLIYDILIEWKSLFSKVPIFQVLVKEFLFPSMKSLFKGLQEDFTTVVSRNGLTSASSITSRIVRIARCFLIDYVVPKWLLLEEFDLIVTFLVHALQPDCGASVSTNVDRLLAPSLSSNRNLVNDQFSGYSVANTGLSSLPIAGAIISRLNLQTGVQGMASNLGKAINNLQGSVSQPGSAGGSSIQATIGAPYLTSLSVSSTTSNLTELGTVVEKPNFIPSHPAGCCLEALLSFFLSDAPIELLKDAHGCVALGNAITAIVISASTVLKSALVLPANVELFEDKIKSSSTTVLMIEKLLTGATANTSALVKALDDLVSSSSLDPADILVLSFQLLQVITRFITKLTFATYKQHTEWSAARTRLFLDEVTLSQFLFYSETQLGYIHTEICNICENVIENLQDSCIICLKFADSDYVVERSLMMIAEIGLITSISGIQKQCDQAISQLCKFTQPIWNSENIHEVDYVVESGSQQHVQNHAPTPSHVHSVRKRHVLAVLRSVQLVCAVADKISEWDSIVSSFEQIQRFYVIQHSSANSDEINDNDIKKVLGILDRFRRFTMFLSSESLVRLMTALVVTSLNSLSSSSEGSQAVDGLSRISYSLLAVVEITKLNSFRASCVWQMVTSHLRMLASMKSNVIRSYAVNATLEMIHATFEGPIDMKTLFPSFKESETVAAETVLASEILPVSDKYLFGHLLPTIENCFEPTRVHKDVIRQRGVAGIREPALSQEDLLSSLKSLSTVKYDDLRFKIVSGVFNMIHTRGHILRGGWVVLIELFQSVAISMIKVVSEEGENSLKSVREIEDEAKEFENSKWPRPALPHTFQCVKFLVDDFLDLMTTDTLKLLISCLASFGEQTVDSNISLSSIETIWKLYDCILLKSKLSTSTQSAGSDHIHTSQNDQILEAAASKLLELSLDDRPEIRNSSLNSLFTLFNRNALRIHALEWQKSFDSVIFPACDQIGLRFSTALHEEMLTPELKKGVKMTVHHSRDTTFKQWSETRSLALLGLEQILKTCTSFLLSQTWFRDVWVRSLGVCKAAIQDSSHDAEVSQTGVTLLFSMLKMSQGSKNTKTSSGDDLWTYAWNSLKDASTFSSPSSELALQMCQSLSSFYSENIADFQNATALKAFLEVVIIISRPRFDSQNLDDSKIGFKKGSVLSAQQLQKAVMSVLKSIQLSSFSSFCHFCSALAEICFSTTAVELFSPLYNELIDLGPCSEKLRVEIGTYLLDVLKTHSFDGDSLKVFHAKNPFVMCDIITGRLLHDNFAALIASRALHENGDVQSLRKSANEVWTGVINVDGEDVELNKFSHAFDLNAGSGAAWDGYVACSFEIDILLELFDYIIKQDACVGDASWMNIAKVTACLLSPWQHREVMKEKSASDCDLNSMLQSYDDFVPKMTTYLDSLFDLAFQEK